LLEAQKQFRQARQDFKKSISSTADHVVDRKLFLAYELVVSVSQKLTRNSIMLRGMHKVARAQFQAVETLVKLSLSGGD